MNRWLLEDRESSTIANVMVTLALQGRGDDLGNVAWIAHNANLLRTLVVDKKIEIPQKEVFRDKSNPYPLREET